MTPCPSRFFAWLKGELIETRPRVTRAVARERLWATSAGTRHSAGQLWFLQPLPTFGNNYHSKIEKDILTKSSALTCQSERIPAVPLYRKVWEARARLRLQNAGRRQAWGDLR
jgi:hypothetical protein